MGVVLGWRRSHELSVYKLCTVHETIGMLLHGSYEHCKNYLIIYYK